MDPLENLENKIDEIKTRLNRRLKRLIDNRDQLLAQHSGQEHRFTYWAGYELGYLKGKIAEIEDMLDEL